MGPSPSIANIPSNNVKYLQRIIRDVVEEDEVVINIYGPSKPPSFGSKNHVSWLSEQIKRENFSGGVCVSGRQERAKGKRE